MFKDLSEIIFLEQGRKVMKPQKKMGIAFGFMEKKECDQIYDRKEATSLCFYPLFGKRFLNVIFGKMNRRPCKPFGHLWQVGKMR